MKKERAKYRKSAKPSKGIVYALLGFASIVIVLGLLLPTVYGESVSLRAIDDSVQRANTELACCDECE